MKIYGKLHLTPDGLEIYNKILNGAPQLSTDITYTGNKWVYKNRDYFVDEYVFRNQAYAVVGITSRMIDKLECKKSVLCPRLNFVINTLTVMLIEKHIVSEHQIISMGMI